MFEVAGYISISEEPPTIAQEGVQPATIMAQCSKMNKDKYPIGQIDGD